MQLILKQLGFAVLALAVAVLVIVPSFIVVHFLLEEGYLVALAGIVVIATTLMVIFSRRYKGGAGSPPSALPSKEFGSKQQVDSLERLR